MEMIEKHISSQTEPLKAFDMFHVLLAFTDQENTQQIENDLLQKVLQTIDEFDGRFPLSDNVEPVSERFSRLSASDTTNHKERLRIETSELAKDVAGSSDGSECDQLLMDLESI